MIEQDDLHAASPLPAHELRNLRPDFCSVRENENSFSTHRLATLVLAHEQSCRVTVVWWSLSLPRFPFLGPAPRQEAAQAALSCGRDFGAPEKQKATQQVCKTDNSPICVVPATLALWGREEGRGTVAHSEREGQVWMPHEHPLACTSLPGLRCISPRKCRPR